MSPFPPTACTDVVQRPSTVACFEGTAVAAARRPLSRGGVVVDQHPPPPLLCKNERDGQGKNEYRKHVAISRGRRRALPAMMRAGTAVVYVRSLAIIEFTAVCPGSAGFRRIFLFFRVFLSPYIKKYVETPLRLSVNNSTRSSRKPAEQEKHRDATRLLAAVSGALVCCTPSRPKRASVYSWNLEI